MEDGPDMPVIDLADVGFAYRKDRRLVHVLHEFSLRVTHGEVVALLGASGCGKSTVLSLISGLNVARSGSVDVLGTDVGALGTKRRADFRLQHVAQVYQDFQLLPMLTAQENVALLLRLNPDPPSGFVRGDALA
jgi:ABC-type lipoprotein export system ATPase subunit